MFGEAQKLNTKNDKWLRIHSKMASLVPYENPHTAFLKKRIAKLQQSTKWNTRISATSNEDIVSDFKNNVFTNLIQSTFTKSYLKRHPCADCGKPATDRCHGVGEERPVLLRRALERIHPDPTQPIVLKTIIIAFLEEHIQTRFTFKCKACHKAESKMGSISPENSDESD